MESPTNDSMLTTITAGLQKDGELYRRIYSKPVKTLRDFYKRSNTHIRMEKAFEPKKHPKKDRNRSLRDRSKRNEGRCGENHNQNNDSHMDDASMDQVAKKAMNDGDAR
ncbi:hypothetical protein ACOSP7_013443 [Xanthoceras sorbifolium]